MDKKEVIGKGRLIGNYGKSIHGGNSMQDAKKIIFLIPQITMA